MAYRVLIADDFMMSRSVFEMAVQMSDRYVLEASVSYAEDAVEYLKTHRVELVIMDVVMNHGMNGLEASRQIKQLHPETRILIVTSMPEVSYLKKAREIGVESFWYKEVQEQPILEIMDRTMAGESVYPDHSPRVQIGNAFSTEFTERELEVLRELVSGASNREIALTLCLSEATIKSYITSMLQKTGFHSRLELAIKARTEGIVIHE